MSRDLEALAEGREALDRINSELVVLLAERFEIVSRVSEAKKRLGLPARDLSRENEMLKRLEQQWSSIGISQSVPWPYAERVLRSLFESSATLQED